MSELIEHRSGAGGKSAMIKGTRVRVSDIAQLYQLHRDELIVERIEKSLPHLSKEQIRAALDYWRSHEGEIAAEIDEEERLLSELASGQ